MGSQVITYQKLPTPDRQAERNNEKSQLSHQKPMKDAASNPNEIAGLTSD